MSTDPENPRPGSDEDPSHDSPPASGSPSSEVPVGGVQTLYEGQATTLDLGFAGAGEATIMIVDDEPVIVETLRSFLEDVGYKNFIPVTESPKALDLLARERPDVVLLDVKMPEVTGLDILNGMRNDEALKHIPAIILTGATDSATKLLSLGLGATDVLGKPVDASELLLRVRNTLTAKAHQDRLVNFDELTGLPNRRQFLERLGNALERARADSSQCALLMIGIDQFKQLNDSLGATVGDGILKALAAALEDHVHEINLAGMSEVEEEEARPARLSGDEFALLIPNVDRVEIATQVARGILSMLESPIQVNGREIFVTVSIGISTYPTDGDSIEALLAGADAAITSAKESGRNTYRHRSKEHNAKSEERLKLEAHLKKAPRQQELFLSFEPKLELATGRVAGAEGSLRWKHSEWGVVPPEKFIPIAEESGLIVPAGEQALYLACALNKQWQKSGIEPIRVSMHVSGREFHDAEHFVVSVRKSLVKTGLAGKFLTLTFDESMLMENPRRNLKTLEALKDLGAMLSLDRFGTGLSSFGYLRHFPLDELKLDGALMDAIPESADEVAVVGAAIDLAHGMGLKVVATGVETEEQLAFLKEAGCDEYQGRLSSARSRQWQKSARQAARALSTGYVGDDTTVAAATAKDGAGRAEAG